MTYDVENRLFYAFNTGTSNAAYYGYDPNNKRTYAGIYRYDWNSGNYTLTGETIYLYGINGQKAGVYNLTINGGLVSLSTASLNVYFGSKLIRKATANDGSAWSSVSPDRLGSIGKYMPYGEDRLGGGGDTEKFATYTRDSQSGLDYAMNRYYNNVTGRFMSADPYRASGRSGDPGSWNRYAYARGDAANRYDPTGLQDEQPVQVSIPYGDRSVTVFASADFVQMMLSFLGGGGGNPDNDFGGEPMPWDEVGKKEYLKEKNDQRDRNGIECNKDIIAAMRAAWAKSANGKSGAEAGFILVGSAQNYTIQEIPFSNQQSQINFKLPPGSFAVIHVHPDGKDPKLSQTDINTANDNSLLIFSESSSGLWRYDSGNNAMTELAVGLRWTNPCQ